MLTELTVTLLATPNRSHNKAHVLFTNRATCISIHYKHQLMTDTNPFIGMKVWTIPSYPRGMYGKLKFHVSFESQTGVSI